jgi:hypothetical protein
MKWPQPTRRDHAKFCQNEGWKQVANSRGKPVGHHVTYETVLPDGNILRTRVSRPISNDVYGPQLWVHILRDQLQVSESEFWACARDGVRPDRGAPEVRRNEQLPADLVSLLIHRVGVPETEIAAMTKAQAVDRVNQYWAQKDE